MAFHQIDALSLKVILEHSTQPRNTAVLSTFHVETNGLTPFCGDETHIQILLDSRERVDKIGVQTNGCIINKASGSMLAEAIVGKSVSEIENLSVLFKRFIKSDLLLPHDVQVLGNLQNMEGVKNAPIRMKCVLLAWSTLDDGICGYRNP